MKTITVISQKGGTGKTTTAIALGAGLQQKGYKVIYVDMDAQGNLTDTLGADSSGESTSVMDVLTGEATAKQAIQNTALGDVIGATEDLAGADLAITSTGKEKRLKRALEGIAEAYDYCIIDTPPELGILTVNALTASQGVVVTAQADRYSLKSIGQLYNTILAVKDNCNPGLYVRGILITRYNPRTVIARDMGELLEQMAERINSKVYSSRIRECSAIKEAQAMSEDIYSYAPKSNATADYTAFIEEFLQDEAQMKPRTHKP